MTTDPDLHEPAAGRQITLEPMRPGLWLIIGGAVIAALGPLFGFLVGSMIGIDDDADLDAIYLYLFLGIVVGGLGVAMLLLGVRRMLRDRRDVTASGS
ncbi:hypothetical protein [Nocardioides ferulae]|uniref:hypothetical protein n=1 Tax=Nocardioides ferulae TaxID=2340821 RepID=UPI000EB1D70E|nr:hypothetical protein [Nocardioides ferulae]